MITTLSFLQLTSQGWIAGTPSAAGPGHLVPTAAGLAVVSQSTAGLEYINPFSVLSPPGSEPMPIFPAALSPLLASRRIPIPTSDSYVWDGWQFTPASAVNEWIAFSVPVVVSARITVGAVKLPSPGKFVPAGVPVTVPAGMSALIFAYTLAFPTLVTGAADLASLASATAQAPVAVTSAAAGLTTATQTSLLASLTGVEVPPFLPGVRSSFSSSVTPGSGFGTVNVSAYFDEASKNLLSLSAPWSSGYPIHLATVGSTGGVTIARIDSVSKTGLISFDTSASLARAYLAAAGPGEYLGFALPSQSFAGGGPNITIAGPQPELVPYELAPGISGISTIVNDGGTFRSTTRSPSYSAPLAGNSIINGF